MNVQKKLRNIFSKKNRVLLAATIRADFKLRYQNSVLGYLWSLLKPLMMFAILYTVFTQFLHIGRNIPNYAISLLLGTILWGFFVEATSHALKSIVSQGSLIRKINIPRYLIPVAGIAGALINMLLNLIVVFIFVISSKNTPLSLASFVWFPLLILELLVLAVAIGFFLSALFVKYRDVEHIWDVFRQALFYAMPIAYPMTLISSVKVQKLLILNPVAQMIQDSRSVITYGGTPTINSLYSNRFVLAIPLGIVLLTLVISVIYFRKSSKYFAENI